MLRFRQITEEIKLSFSRQKMKRAHQQDATASLRPPSLAAGRRTARGRVARRRGLVATLIACASFLNIFGIFASVSFTTTTTAFVVPSSSRWRLQQTQRGHRSFRDEGHIQRFGRGALHPQPKHQLQHHQQQRQRRTTHVASSPVMLMPMSVTAVSAAAAAAAYVGGFMKRGDNGVRSGRAFFSQREQNLLSSPDISLPMEEFDFAHEAPHREPFDLDVAVFLANFAFEAYRDPGRMSWGVPGRSSIHFKSGDLVSKVFPGMLTVSLLTAEGLPKVTEASGSREREIHPRVTMVLSDKDIRSDTKSSDTKPLMPGGRYWGEVFSMHVHDPGSSVLEVGLWDRGDDGGLPLSVAGVFRGGGEEMVGTARVPLPRILKAMNRGRGDTWTGWVEMEPIAESQNDGAPDKDKQPAADSSSDGSTKSDSQNDKRLPKPRVQLDIRFAPMDGYHGDLPTAPQASEDDVGVAGVGRALAQWRDLILEDLGTDEDRASVASSDRVRRRDGGSDDSRRSPSTSPSSGESGGDTPSTSSADEESFSGNMLEKIKEGAEGAVGAITNNNGGSSSVNGHADSNGNSAIAVDTDGEVDVDVVGDAIEVVGEDKYLESEEEVSKNVGILKAVEKIVLTGSRQPTQATESESAGEGEDSKGQPGSVSPEGQEGRNNGEDGDRKGWLGGLAKSNIVDISRIGVGVEADRTSGSLFSGGVETSTGKGNEWAGRGRSNRVGGGNMVLREDGLPDWTVLTDRVGGLAQQTSNYELLCFIENDDTDTQVGVWQDEANKRLVVSFRGTEEDRWGDVLTDVNFLLDELDQSGATKDVVPAADDLFAAVRNTTTGWKKERVKPLPETIGLQKEMIQETLGSVLENGRDLVRNLQVNTVAAKASAVINSTVAATATSATAAVAAVTALPELDRENWGHERADNVNGNTTTAGDQDEETEVLVEGKGNGGAASGIFSKAKVLVLGGETEGEVDPICSESDADTDNISSSSSSSDVSGGGVVKNGEKEKAEKEKAKKGKKRVTDAAESVADAAADLVKGDQASAASNADGLSDGVATGTGIGPGPGSDVPGTQRSRWRRWMRGIAKGGKSSAVKGVSVSDEDDELSGMISDAQHQQQVLADEVKEEFAKRPGGLPDTFAWVQQVAEDKMEEIAAVQMYLNTVSKEEEDNDNTSRKDANNNKREVLSLFMRDQLDKVEAIKDLVDKVNDVKDSLGATESSGGVQEQGWRVFDDKIRSLQDMLTNATLPLGDTAANTETPKIHSGFKSAYVSVNRTLSAVVSSAMDGKPEDWHVFMTGHSLGGALATLAALDHRRRYPAARVTMYNFGSPRVGNRAFANLYDSFVGDSFRVVNNMDVVARMPRGTMGGISLDYCHSGRTVMVAEDPSEPPWIQGESGGLCPLDETDPVALLTKGSTDFFDAEMKILQGLFTGEGISHHMEVNYYSALDSFYIPGETNRA